MARQFIVSGFPFPVFVNEAGVARQYIVSGAYLNETVQPPARWTLTADAASYALTGTTAEIIRGAPLAWFDPDLVAASWFDHELTVRGWFDRDWAAVPIAPAVGYILAASAGSYILAGAATNLLHTYRPIALAGTYSLAGAVTTNVLHKWTVTAASASYALTGTTAALTKLANKSLVAGAASYAVTGAATFVLHQWKSVAAAGNYNLTGSIAGIGHIWKVAAAVGAYSITGAQVTFSHVWKLPAGIGSYALTGTAAGLNRATDRILQADPGSYTLAGSAVAVLVGRKLAATAGSYALIGTVADIVSSAVTPPIYGGGGIARPPLPYPVDGIGYGILPPLEGEAFGAVIISGAGEGRLPHLVGSAAGSIGAVGNSAAQFAIKAVASGERGQAGVAVAQLNGIAAVSLGRAGARGKGFGMIMNLKSAATGEYVDDEAAAVTFLLAA